MGRRNVGGGKTHLICSYLIINSLKYPGTRWGLARAHLLTIKKTTANTLNQLLQDWGLSHLVVFNSMTNIYKFTNGSEIVLLDTFVKPSDSLKDSWGGLELSGVVIDELGETSKMSYDVLYSRIRYKLNEYNLKPFMLSASNPCRGWVHQFFITNPSKNTRFLQSLVTDNKYLPLSYITSLNQLDGVLKRRLLFGDWNYNQSDDDLFNLEEIEQLFYNQFYEPLLNDENYISVDPSDSGDKCIITIWKGLNVVRLERLKGMDGIEIARRVKEFMSLYKVQIRNVIVDSVGLGQATSQNLKGCIEFMGSNSPVGVPGKFINLRAQCIWKLSDMVHNNSINFNFVYDEDLCNQMLLHKQETKDGKFKVTGKDKIKQQLGHSPDEFDSIYMRMYYLLKKTGSMNYTIIK